MRTCAIIKADQSGTKKPEKITLLSGEIRVIFSFRCGAIAINRIAEILQRRDSNHGRNNAEGMGRLRRRSWTSNVNVRDFIQKNYTPYEGDESFLVGPTATTTELWNEVLNLFQKERENGGVLDMDTKIVSTVNSHEAGYLDKDKETIVGFQTDKPLKRSLQPFGGIRMAEEACKAYGYEVDPEISYIFKHYRKTHNEGVFDVYTPEMRAARHNAIITGLPGCLRPWPYHR